MDAADLLVLGTLLDTLGLFPLLSLEAVCFNFLRHGVTFFGVRSQEIFCSARYSDYSASLCQWCKRFSRLGRKSFENQVMAQRLTREQHEMISTRYSKRPALRACNVLADGEILAAVVDTSTAV